MKKNLFLILLSLFGLNSFAQQTSQAEPSNTYFSQPALEKFYGTWVYEKDGLYFSITLEKYITINARKNSFEFLKGTHTLKQNGKIVDARTAADTLTSINIGSMARPSESILNFRFTEYRRQVFGRGTMEYVPGPTPTLIWKLIVPDNRRRIILPGEENLKEVAYVVPTNAVLHKVK